MARLEPKARKAQLLDAACAICEVAGIEGVTLASVARKCGVSHGLVARYFTSRQKLRRAVNRALASIQSQF